MIPPEPPRPRPHSVLSSPPHPPVQLRLRGGEDSGCTLAPQRFIAPHLSQGRAPCLAPLAWQLPCPTRSWGLRPVGHAGPSASLLSCNPSGGVEAGCLVMGCPTPGLCRAGVVAGWKPVPSSHSCQNCLVLGGHVGVLLAINRNLSRSLES